MQFLSMEDKFDNLHLLTFHNLLYLTVEISEKCSWNMLVSFLQNAPQLKDLAIMVCMMFFELYLHNIFFVKDEI